MRTKYTYLNDLNTLIDENQFAQIHEMCDEVHPADVIKAEIEDHQILYGLLFDVQEVTLWKKQASIRHGVKSAKMGNDIANTYDVVKAIFQSVVLGRWPPHLDLLLVPLLVVHFDRCRTRGWIDDGRTIWSKRWLVLLLRFLGFLRALSVVRG